MKWVSIKLRKPSESAYYYWKGKSGYGGKEYFDVEEGAFQFDEKVIPSNKISEEYLYWLDENNAEYEENND